MIVLDGCTGIAQGALMLFSDFAHDGEMWAGTGERTVQRSVRFETPFAEAPAVHVSIGLADIDSSGNVRTDIRAEAITSDGFTICFTTWADTRVARIRADWTAIGPLPDPDRWNID